MKKLRSLFLALFQIREVALFVLALVFVVVPLAAFAAQITDQVPTDQFLMKAYLFVTSLKGAGTLAICTGVAQLLMWFFQTPLGNVAGIYRLSAVAVFTFLSVLASMLVTGTPFAIAVFSPPVIAALQIAVHQVVVQIGKKADDQAVKLPPPAVQTPPAAA
jgi:hypothetical protein